MTGNLIGYYIILVSQVFCYAYSGYKLYYYRRKSYRSMPVDVVANIVYFSFSIYYNVEFWMANIISCRLAYVAAIAGVSLVGPAFFMQICDLYYTRALHSIENFRKIKELNLAMAFYSHVHNNLKYAVLFFFANAVFLLLVLIPSDYPSYDGLWQNDLCPKHSRVFPIIIPKYIFILGNLILAILLYRWKEGQEFRFYMIYSMIAIGTATIFWSIMFEYADVQASPLPYIWVCSFWIFLSTMFGNIIDKAAIIFQNNIKQGFVDDIPNTIEETLANPFFFDLWKKFVAIEFSTENTLCYLDIIRIEKNDPEAMGYDTFQCTYLSHNATYEVNISDSLRRTYLQDKTLSAGKLDALKREILHLMKIDTFSRFPDFVRKERNAGQI